jgi:hypothetical protein
LCICQESYHRLEKVFNYLSGLAQLKVDHIGRLLGFDEDMQLLVKMLIPGFVSKLFLLAAKG